MVRSPSAAVVAALFAFVLVGCGSTGSGDGTVDLAAAGAEPHTEETLVDSMLAALEDNRSVRIQGSVGSYEFDAVAQAGDVDEFAAAGTVDKGDQSYEGIFVDGTAYVRDADDDVYGQVPDEFVDKVLSAMGSVTERQAVEVLHEAIESVEFAGSEDIDGEELDRYDLTIDGGFLTEQLTSHLPKLEDLKLSDVQVLLWLDDADLARRAEIDTGFLQVEVTFSEWGEPVAIEAPPASQVEPLELPER